MSGVAIGVGVVATDFSNPGTNIYQALGGATSGTVPYSFVGDDDTGMYSRGANIVGWTAGGTGLIEANAAVGIKVGTTFGFASAIAASTDITLAREAAQILGLRNAANPMTLRVYNTFTDASNYEAGNARWNTNVFEVGTSAAGTGTSRALRMVAAGTTTISFNTGGSDNMVLDSNSKLFLNGSAAFNVVSAPPAGGTAGLGVTVSSTTNLGLFFGSGLPTLAAAQGSIYIRTDGSSTSTRLYVNTNGTTGWTNFTSAA